MGRPLHPRELGRAAIRPGARPWSTALEHGIDVLMLPTHMTIQ